MAGGVPDYAQAVATLRRCLEEAADALGRADLERILDCETRIHGTLTHLCTATRITRAAEAPQGETSAAADAQLQLSRDIDLARAALLRCRRLGQALNEFVRLTLSAQGLDEPYGRSGASVAAELRTMHRTA